MSWIDEAKSKLITAHTAIKSKLDAPVAAKPAPAKKAPAKKPAAPKV